MTKGRKKDHVWKLVKFKGNTAIFARCSCGFTYGCSDIVEKDSMFKVEINTDKLYNYCPNCGARKTWYDDEVKRLDRYLW